MDVWFYDSFLNGAFLCHTPEDLVSELAEEGIESGWNKTPIYFFAELTTENV